MLIKNETFRTGLYGSEIIVKVASAQIAIVPGDPVGNLYRAQDALAQAKQYGAVFVVLPECSNFGWTDRSALSGASEIADDPFLLGIRESARKHSLHVAVGFVERDSDTLFNSAVLIDATGNTLLHHRKIHELDFAQEIYSTGTVVSTTITEFGTVGLMICADALSETDRVIERLIEKGANLILSPSAWAVPPDHDNERNPYGALWIDAYRRGLQDSQTWIIATSNVGVVREGVWAGHLCIGNSIAMGPNDGNLHISHYGAGAVHIQLIDVQLSD